MADKSFGVKELNLLNASGTPTVTSPNNLNLNANTVAISTSCTVGSNLTVSGDIDVDGHTNLDNLSVAGVSTFADDITVQKNMHFGDSPSGTENLLSFGAGDDLNIFHSGNGSFIRDSGTGSLTILTNQFLVRNAANNEELIEAFENSSVSLFFNGTKRLETTNTGAVVTGILTATTFSGDPSNDSPHSLWDVVNNSASSYRFTGPGQDGAEDNPDIYLVRGQRYVFKMNASGHPFQIRVANGGAAYSDGVTNNGAQTGNVVFNVQHDAPAQLYYQCTSHGGMVGNIYIVGGPQVISGVVTATTFSGNLSGGTVSGTTGTFTNNLSVAQNIVHIGDTDTKIEFLNDTIALETAGSERVRIAASGQIGLGGANYGTSGQVLMSQGSGSAVQWASPVVAGSILQTVYGTTTGEGVTTSSSFQNFTALNTNITRMSSNSHLWIWINAVRLLVQQDSNEARIRITDGTSSTVPYRLVNYDSDGNYLSFNPCLNWYWTKSHTAGTTVTITPQFRNTNGSGNIIWGDNGDTSMMIIQEIAQ